MLSLVGLAAGKKKIVSESKKGVLVSYKKWLKRQGFQYKQFKLIA